MNYNGYDAYGSSSQSIGRHDDHNYSGQYNFTHQGGPNNQYDSSSQFGSQYGGHNYIGGFGGQYGGHNYVGGYDVMNQNGLNDQNGFGGQTNQVAWGQYTYPGGQNNPANIYDQPNYYSHQADHPIGFGGQHNLKVGEMPSSDHTYMGKNV
ncbi:shematrin-like protein 1 [Prunus yedoensis var. nudiflora]|uniref:Shematrin-like protein 1 n=1 Tax=Prunus yedoensis var. nudiflora TaxID=2094558 RepID=A0A314UJE3_PRUYE|nr:shematrin-like protein 1 [Prunus yedoensis var. nudiflora]